MPRLLEGVVHDVAPYTDGPYVLFGHSMGAVVAIEVARRLSAARRPPAWVGISGRAAPRTHEAAALRLSDLADDRLSAVLLSLGGTPSRIREMPEFHAHFLRVARADLQALDSHRPDPGRVPLPCPLTAFGGIADPWAPPAGMPDWEHETSGEFRQCFFPGGHFYFLDSAFDPLSREICQEVRAALRATGYRPAARTA
jgi:surfactin synthase thioesterase subunit